MSTATHDNKNPSYRSVSATLSTSLTEIRIPVFGSASLCRIECFAVSDFSKIKFTSLNSEILTIPLSRGLKQRLALENLKIPVSDFILLTRLPESSGVLTVQLIIEEGL